MILVDYSGISMGALFSHGSNPKNLDEGLIRHMILNSLRMYNVKYRQEYGEMILCCDGGSWRKDVMAEYKAHRKTNRDESDIPWDEVFFILNKIRQEIEEHLPYRVIWWPRAEADDVIAALVETTQEFGRNEPVMIISSDNDFLQLQIFSNVRQFSPLLKKNLVEKNPDKFLREKILRGDAGDGVPNVLSASNTFLVEGLRQVPLSAKKIEAFLAGWNDLERIMTREVYANFKRNQRVLHLGEMPADIKSGIINTFEHYIPAPQSKILNYLITRRCAQLVSAASEFFPHKL